ncbi:hypothetical protein CPB83DRAFT_854469, partial [Crepidotus variabilis]
MHLQVRNLGREWSFEVGIVDQAGQIGIIRLSTFQKEPRLKQSTQAGRAPLLLLPLVFPASSSHPLTAWSTISIHFPTLLPYFSSPLLRSRSQNDPDSVETTQENTIGNHSVLPTQASQLHGGSGPPAPTPTGTYSHISYVRIYANCRLRRIWLSESGPSQKVPWEFELYSR